MQISKGHIIFKTPEVFSPHSVKYFIKEVSPLFKMANKAVPNVLFNADGLKKTNLLGQLLIYKFMEYSFKKNCFHKPEFSIKKDIFNEFKKTGFQNLVLSYVNDTKKEFEKLKFEEEDGVFIAPINLVNFENDDYQNLYVPQIRDYYTNLKVAFIATLCMSEIAANYSAHAVDDTNSILVAKGNLNYFEIACADNGKGIISSLRPAIVNNYNSHEMLALAMQKGVTSKKGTCHMGYGLWLVNKIVSTLKGELAIYSEKAYYTNIQGKIKKGDNDFWQGTITHIRLPLNSRNNVDAVYENLKNKHNKIKIQRYNG